MERDFVIYGVRLKGDTEVRYVGVTTQGLRRRHFNHRGDASSPIQRWLLDNGNEAETFAITRCATRPEALATERLLITACLAMNHRLFNRDGVPKHLRRDRLMSTGRPLQKIKPSHFGTIFSTGAERDHV